MHNKLNFCYKSNLSHNKRLNHKIATDNSYLACLAPSTLIADFSIVALI